MQILIVLIKIALLLCWTGMLHCLNQDIPYIVDAFDPNLRH